MKKYTQRVCTSVSLEVHRTKSCNLRYNKDNFQMIVKDLNSFGIQETKKIDS